LPSHSRRGRASTRDRIDERTRDAPEHAEEMAAVALRIWQNSAPAPGTIAEVYLHARGIVLPIPSSLRFHPGLKHPSGSFWPTMVALVTNGITDRPQAIHRTFLMLDGSDKAPVEPTKMMLGPCQGGAVRLGPVSEHLLIGEGIETCLSAMQATGIPAWAALSTSGLTALGLPPEVRQVTILADGEDAGEKAAQSAARRWVREGRRVRIARAGWGLDFNDLLVGRRPEIEEIAE
jgi:putative DNA primase/helicase